MREIDFARIIEDIKARRRAAMEKDLDTNAPSGDEICVSVGGDEIFEGRWSWLGGSGPDPVIVIQGDLELSPYYIFVSEIVWMAAPDPEPKPEIAF